MKKHPYKSTMWAIIKNGEVFMILPDIDTAETHFGLWSKNGFSIHKWSMRKVEVRLPHETAAERHKRMDRHVQAVVALNQSLVR